jgi:hypothetical protein
MIQLTTDTLMQLLGEQYVKIRYLEQEIEKLKKPKEEKK